MQTVEKFRMAGLDSKTKRKRIQDENSDVSEAEWVRIEEE